MRQRARQPSRRQPKRREDEATQATAKFGRRLLEIREARLFTLEELAERSGISVRLLKRWETGRARRPVTLGQVHDLARALGVTCADLLGEPGDPIPLSLESVLAAGLLDRLDPPLQEAIVALLAKVARGISASKGKPPP